MPVSVLLARGQCHVAEFMSPDLIEFFGLDPTGMPIREAFPDGPFRDFFAALDRVYRTGEAEQIQRPVGLVTVLPWRSGGQILGVSAHVAVVSPPRRLPLVVPVGARAFQA
jgi:hypothetical protein